MYQRKACWRVVVRRRTRRIDPVWSLLRERRAWSQTSCRKPCRCYRDLCLYCSECSFAFDDGGADDGEKDSDNESAERSELSERIKTRLLPKSHTQTHSFLEIG